MPVHVPRRLALFHGWTRLRCSVLYMVLAVITLVRYWDRSDLTSRIEVVGTEVQILGYGRIMSKVYSMRNRLGTDLSDFLMEYYMGRILMLRGA